MFGECWDVDEAPAPSRATELVRGKIFRGRGRGFLTEREEVPKSRTVSSLERTNNPEKSLERTNSPEKSLERTNSPEKSSGSESGGSESGDSESGDESGSQSESAKSRDHNPRDTSGNGDSPKKSNDSKYSDDEGERREDNPPNWNPRKSNASKYSDDEGERREDNPPNWNPRKSNASKYSDDEGERREDSPKNWNPRKSHASRYSDEERERHEDTSRNWNPRKSNASKYSDDEGERREDSPPNWNPRKSHASRYSDEERERREDSPPNWNPRKSHASRYSDEERERHEDTSRNWNPRKSHASRYSDEERERHEDTSRNWNPRKSNASKYSDDEERERHEDTSRNWNPRKSNASKYSDDEGERREDNPPNWNPRKSHASRYSDEERERHEDTSRNWNPRKSHASRYSDEERERHEDTSRNWNPRKSNASKYFDDEAERYQDSPEDFSHSDRRENMSMRRRQGRNDNGWNKENLWDNDRRGKQEQQQQQPPPRKNYIPNPDPENEEDLFSQNIASGINFDRYDDIQVTVTGEDIPPKIERFEEAEICELVMRNIRKSSYVKPTPVQKHALPIIMSGRDMMACAQTGSGKTAAFLIPTINCMLETGDVIAADRRTATPQLLIVTPTRELALQIYVEAKKLTYGSDLITEICYGGTDVRHQLNKVQRGCNILIATCGRLIDFLNRGAVSLCRLRHLIIDEADKMLDRGFYDDIETIIKHETTSKEDRPQNLLFSATFPDEVQNLARMFLREYIFIAVGIIGAACQDVEQRFYLVYKHEKKSKLINMLEQELNRSKTLVFVQHKRIADIIAAKLSEIGFPATSMHGDREQREREEALRDFRGGKANILVATAVAARGLDIRGINYVINYDLPQTVDEYVHRIGRTGRVGNRGLAISFFDPDSDSSLVPGISRILAQSHHEIPHFF